MRGLTQKEREVLELSRGPEHPWFPCASFQPPDGVLCAECEALIDGLVKRGLLSAMEIGDNHMRAEITPVGLMLLEVSA